MFCKLAPLQMTEYLCYTCGTSNPVNFYQNKGKRMCKRCVSARAKIAAAPVGLPEPTTGVEIPEARVITIPTQLDEINQGLGRLAVTAAEINTRLDRLEESAREVEQRESSGAAPVVETRPISRPVDNGPIPNWTGSGYAPPWLKISDAGARKQTIQWLRVHCESLDEESRKVAEHHDYLSLLLEQLETDDRADAGIAAV